MKILKFYAEWCGPCKLMAPIIEQVAKNYGLEVAAIDIDSEAGSFHAKNFDIKSIPTVVLVADNMTEITRAAGYMTETQLMDKLGNAQISPEGG